MDRLRILAGGDDQHYQRYYLSVVRNLAAYVQLLPASKADTHQGAGGLFRLCLELGFFALQSAERVVFAGQATIELRRELEPRWRYATFLTALCCELYRPLSDMVVTNQAGHSWPIYLKSLTEWGEEANIDRYFVQWHKSKPLHTFVSGRSDVAVLMRSILPEYTLQYLSDVSVDVVPVVFSVASGSAHPADNAIAKIVHEIREKIYKRDAATRKDNYGKNIVGNHLEPYLLDAMRHLYRSGVWKINGQKSRLWLSEEGLFIIWKSAAKEIQKALADNGVSGVPNDISTLAEILCDAKITERNGAGLYWFITTPESNEEWQSVKIMASASILEDDEVEPVLLTVKKEKGATSMAPTKPVSETTAKPQKESAPKEKTKTEAKVEEARPAPIDAQRDLTALEDEAAAAPPDVPKQTATTAPETSGDSKSSKEANAPTVASKPEKSEGRKKEPIDPNAEIAPVVKQTSYGDLIPPAARNGLKPDVREVIGKMIDDYRKGRHKQSILDHPKGIAFENQQVLRYGLSYDRIVGLLHSNDWLVTPENNPNAKNIKVAGPEGKNVTCIVIKHQAAKHLGFIQEEDE